MNKITLDLFLAKSKTAIQGLFVLFAFLLMNTQTSWGQTVIAIQDFETVPATPTWSWTGTATAESTASKFNGTKSLRLTGSNTVTFDNIDLTGYTNVTLSVAFASAGADSGEDLFMDISYDNGTSWTGLGSIKLVDGFGNANININTTNALDPTTVGSNPYPTNISNSQTQIKVRFRPVGLDASEYYFIDDVKITGTAVVVSAPVISNVTLTASTTVLAANANIFTVTASGTPTAFAASGLPDGLTISSSGIISGTPTTGTAAGSPYTVELTATNSAGTSDPVNLTLTINKANQTITFTPTLITKAIGDTPVPLTASSTSGLAVSYGTSDSGVASLSGSTLSFVGAGTAIITASQAGDVDYNAATSVTQDQVVSAAPLSDQTITFGALTPVTYGDTTFGLTATASSSLPVTYTSSNEAVATVSGSTVTIVSAGSTDITASQGGNGSFNPAANVMQTLTVNAKALTISGAAAESRAYNTLLTTTITGTLTGIVGLDDVTFDGTLKGTFANENVADGIAVTAACTLAGTKAGNYTLTQPTGLTANITQATQTITFAALTGKVVGDPTFELTGTASSGLTVTYTSSNTAVATVSGTTVTIVGAGSTDITASQTGDANYAAATNVVRSLTVTALPIAAWQFGSPAALGTEVTYNATTNNANLNTVVLSRGTGIAGTALGRAFASNSWSATGTKTSAKSENEYFQFAVNVKPGYKLNLTALDATIRRSGTTAPNAYIWAYSTDGTNFTDIGSDVSYTDTSTNGLPQTQIDLSGISALQNVENITTLTFRLYAWGGTSTTATFSIGRYATGATTNSLAITGTIVAATSTTWNGTAWTSGAPSASLNAIIDGDLSSTGTLNTKNLTVNSTRTLTVASGSVTVAEAIVNNGTITVENNANLRQTAENNTNSGSGTATVKRNSAALKRLDYTMWSSPVSGQTLEGFSQNTSRNPNQFWTYDAATNKFVNVPTTSTFTAGLGYLIRMPNDATTTPTAFEGQFTGIPNNGTITLSSLAPNKFYSVGNPYPSTLDANAFLNGNSTGGTLYFWRKTNGVAGSAYATRNLVGGSASGAGSEDPNGTIQVGQGFIVKTGAAANQLVFTNAMRLGTTSTQFFKTRKETEKSRLWLNLTNTAGLFSQALVGYLDGATLGVDNGYDGLYINDSATALTSIIDGEEYTIQGRPAFDATDVVALGFKTVAAGNFTIAVASKDGVFAADQDIYLVDSKTGTVTDLKANSYTFAAEAGVDNSRFSLKYQKTLKVGETTFDENTVKVFKNNGTIYVNSADKSIKTIEVYDVQGRLVAKQTNVKSNTATISNLKAVRQMLIVKVSADDNSVVSKKVMN